MSVTSVTSIKPLLVSAIINGRADGVLVGPAAAAIAAQFGSSAPIRVSVRVVKAFADSACRRLEVTTRQDAVIEDNRAPASKQFQYEINFCADGSFPEDRR